MKERSISRKTLIDVKKMILASMFMVLGILLPFVIGNQPSLGSIWLPMHIPILIAGLILGPKYGLLAGLFTPILRSLLFGMPPLYPFAVTMAFELAAYGFMSGFISNLLPKKFNAIYISLVTAMLFGRLVWGLFASIFYRLAGIPFGLESFVRASFVISLPGMIVQIIFIPVFVYYLSRTGIIDMIET